MKYKLLALSILISIALRAQNVGIGETTPASKLAVKGAMSIGSGFSTTSAPANGAIIQGKLGIGTTLPTGLLHVENCNWSYDGTNMAILEDTIPAMTGGPSLRFRGPYSTFDIIGSGSTFFGAYPGYFNILNLDNHQVGLCISPFGTIGLGTNIIEVKERLTVLAQSDTNLLNGGLRISTPSGVAELSIGASGMQSSNTNQNLSLNANGTGNILMQYSHTTGNVGIGTTTPAAKLDVAGNIKSTNLQMTTGATSGYLLQSDAAGNATWVNPTSATPNIYNASGSLTAARTVTIGANNLTLNSTTGNFIFNPTSTGYVGIGTNAPLTTLQVAGGSILATGTIGAGSVPAIAGVGARMMWLGYKGAFRAGFVHTTEWDTANIGLYSIGLGQDAEASGQSSMAVAGGRASNASSIAMGPGAVASGNFTFAVHGGEALGDYSIAFGTAIASGSNSLALCNGSNASGSNSVAIGYATKAPSAFEIVLGSNNTRYTPASTTSFVSTDRLFTIGNGSQSSGTFGSDAMVILKNGNVGIGTSTPNAPLHIGTANSNGITTGSIARSYFYGSSGTAITQNTSASGNIMIQADGWYWANGGGYVSTSDERIKNIFGQSDSEKDLASLSQIKITDYKYKDEMANGAGMQKKVIAQQLNEVYPQAVRKNTLPEFIPNIYQVAKSYSISGSIVTIALSEEVCDMKDIKAGGNCKFYLYAKGDGAQKEMKGTIVSFDDKKIVIAVTEKIEEGKYDDRLFVYGTEINDLLSVDYEAISMLNVSATQELEKQLKDAQAQISLLKGENGKLQSDVDKLKASVGLLQEIMGAKAEK